MECEICIEDFNETDRRPKNLPCAHTVCLACLLAMKNRNCPQCRKGFAEPPQSLPENYQVTKILRSKSERSCEEQWWCLDCNSVAVPRCKGIHAAIILKEALRRKVGELQDEVPQLTQSFEELKGQLDQTQALAAMQLLGGQAATSCSVVLRQNGGRETFRADWQMAAPAGKPQPHDRLLAMLIAVLAGKSLIRRQEDTGAAKNGDGARGCSSREADSWEKMFEVPEKPLFKMPKPKHQSTGPAQPGQSAGPAHSSPIDAMDLYEESSAGPGHLKERKASLLNKARRSGIRRLTAIFCEIDSGWCVSMLQAAAPHLEELEACRILGKHIPLVAKMTRLRRLYITSATSFLASKNPPVFPPLSGNSSGLQWLCATLPRSTLVSLLQAHSKTLRSLALFVGTRHRNPESSLHSIASMYVGNTTSSSESWPDSCNDLQNLFKNCNLHALQQLCLIRDTDFSHTEADCIGQIKAVERVLKDVRVDCMTCYPDVLF